MKQLKFNAEMAQAVKDGRKTQTRRPLKPQPHLENGLYVIGDNSSYAEAQTEDELLCELLEICPYKIGDTHDVDGTQIRITNIRVERLQDISPEDAMAEGVKGRIMFDGNSMSYAGKNGVLDDVSAAVDEYEKEIWYKLPYQPPYDWNSNPYVWVIEFEVLDEEVKEAQEKFEKSGVLIL